MELNTAIIHIPTKGNYLGEMKVMTGMAVQSVVDIIRHRYHITGKLVRMNKLGIMEEANDVNDVNGIYYYIDSNKSTDTSTSFSSTDISHLSEPAQRAYPSLITPTTQGITQNIN